MHVTQARALAVCFHILLGTVSLTQCSHVHMSVNHGGRDSPRIWSGVLDRGYNTIKHCDKTAKTKSTTVDCFSVLALLQLLQVPATTLR